MLDILKLNCENNYKILFRFDNTVWFLFLSALKSFSSVAYFLKKGFVFENPHSKL